MVSTYPSEKWWTSSVGMMTFSQYDGKNKSHVPNHQPVLGCLQIWCRIADHRVSLPNLYNMTGHKGGNHAIRVISIKPLNKPGISLSDDYKIALRCSNSRMTINSYQKTMFNNGCDCPTKKVINWTLFTSFSGVTRAYIYYFIYIPTI